MKAGPCHDGPLAGQSIAVPSGTRFCVPSLTGYNAAGQPVYGQWNYRWSDELKMWVTE